MRMGQAAGCQASSGSLRLKREPRRCPDGRPLRGLLTAMDQISESALVLAAAVHDRARAPREALAPYRAALDGSFAETVSSLDGDARSASARPSEQAPCAAEHNPALAPVAAETDRVLAALEAARAEMTQSVDRSAASGAESAQADKDDRRDSPQPLLTCRPMHRQTCERCADLPGGVFSVDGVDLGREGHDDGRGTGFLVGHVSAAPSGRTRIASRVGWPGPRSLLARGEEQPRRPRRGFSEPLARRSPA